MTSPKVEQKKERNPYTWPDLAIKEFLVMIAVMIGLTIWSLWLDAPLMEEATPARTENPAKAPWYFVGLQEILVYFDPWYAGVVLPGIIILGLILIPYLDVNREGTGEYSFAKRKFAMINFLFGYGLWMGAIVIGQFLRGPNWFWFWPWESWETTHVVDEAIVFKDLGLASGLTGLALYFGFGFWWPIYRKWRIAQILDRTRYTLVMVLLLLMYAVPVKMFLRLAFDIRNVLVTPWLNF